MSQAVKVVSLPQSLLKPLDDEPTIQGGIVDQPDLRLDRARRALRGLSGLIYAANIGDECLIGSAGDIQIMIELVREELEAGLTGKRLAL
jgi:hypothetical protein